MLIGAAVVRNVAMPSYRDILKKEFSAQDGSFLLRLHVWNDWDRHAFTRVTTAMCECCETQEGQETIERWLADGFWTVYGEVIGCVERNYPRPAPRPDYFKKAVARVHELAYWYFSGTSPSLPGTTLEPI
jgi:hypothetical protein